MARLRRDEVGGVRVGEGREWGHRSGWKDEAGES